MTTRPLFIGAGPVLVDQFVHCDVLPQGDGLPEPGGKLQAVDADHMTAVRKKWVEGWTTLTQVGGPTLVALRQAKQFGAIVDFIGAVGSDELGARISEDLFRHGIDPKGLVIQHGRHSGSAIVWIDRNGERSILFDSGTLEPLEPGYLRPVTHLVPRVAHIDSREPLLAAELAMHAHRHHATVHYDVDPWEPWTPDLAGTSDVVQVSYRMVQDARAYEQPPAEVAKLMQEKFDLSVAILTEGADGLHAYERDGSAHFIPGFNVPSSDSVGAGDVFAGAFEMACVEGRSTANALRFAAATSAIHTTRLGNEELATTEEVEGLLAKN